ncbi:hypothetical protein LMG33818_001509 [Halomonadaceae bacterium LMG 33818]|uniref:DUF484 family protein n=1 Tax=Cernens ardua TaxID=3402176 RepID=UPI003EDB9CD5
MSQPTSPSPDLSADIIERWLFEHPDFFHGRDALLEVLKVPHPDAEHGAISLLEKQLLMARERSKRLDDRLTALLNAARDTEIQYRQLRSIILTLLESDSVDALLQGLSDQLNEQLNIAAMALWRTTDPNEQLAQPIHSLDEPHQALFKQLLKGRHCGCTQLTKAQYHFVLPDILESGSSGAHSVSNTSKGDKQQAANEIQRDFPAGQARGSGSTNPDIPEGEYSEAPSQLTISQENSHDPQNATYASIALTRIAIGHQTGFLVLGSPSPTRFNASLDTLFIDYLGQVVGRLLHGFSTL